MRLSATCAVTALLTASAALAQSSDAPGPKVHVTDVEDTTNCVRERPANNSGIRTIAGSVVGNRILPGYGGLAGQTAGQVADAAAANSDKREKCQPTAYAEGDEPAPAPKKKKGLGALRSSLGL